VAVVWIFSAFHGDFIAVVNLRHSAHRGQNGECKVEALQRGSRLVHEARDIVVAEKRHQTFRVRIEGVEAENIGKPAHGHVFEENIP